MSNITHSSEEVAMRPALLAIALLVLGGCPQKECTTWGVLESVCEYIVDCTDTYGDVDECISDEPLGNGEIPEGCVLDCEMVDACKEALEEIVDCEPFAIPTACESFYDCP